MFNVQVEAFALWGDRKFQELSDNISLESRLDFFRGCGSRRRRPVPLPTVGDRLLA